MSQQFNFIVSGIRFEVVAFYRTKEGIELSMACFSSKNDPLGFVDLLVYGTECSVVRLEWFGDDEKTFLDNIMNILCVQVADEWRPEKVILKLGRRSDPVEVQPKGRWKL